MKRGHLFSQLVVEFFLKTAGRRWGEHVLPCDDPFAVFDDERNMFRLFEPSKPFHTQEPFLEVSAEDVLPDAQTHLAQMGHVAQQTFLALEKAWQLQNGRLVDFKLEFGLDQGVLRLADVIDNDSWRVIHGEQHLDKQLYRDGGDLRDVAARYARVAAMTAAFTLPLQRIIVWQGSSSDNAPEVFKELEAHNLVEHVTCSAHKEPLRAAHTLARLVHEVPDCVVIVYVGRSNGAGPTLSAMTHVPVITVPASFKNFPEDVWSSLRTPSDVPVSTILDPANVALHAQQILAMRNPALYALLRSKIEWRLLNTVPM